VELVPSVAELFVEFNPRAEVALRNEGGTVIIGDGRSYLLSAKKPYDIVVIEKTSLPQYGTSSLPRVYSCLGFLEALMMIQSN
jgi:spermidine synthase